MCPTDVAKSCLWRTHLGPPSGGGLEGPGQVLLCLLLSQPPSPRTDPDSGRNGAGLWDGGRYLEYAGSVWCPPGIEKVIFPSAHKPLACRREAKEAVRLCPAAMKARPIPDMADCHGNAVRTDRSEEKQKWYHIWKLRGDFIEGRENEQC